MAHAQLKLGLLKMMQQKYDSAAKHLEYSLLLQEQLEITLSGSKSFFNAETLINLGIVYLNLGQTNRAGAFLEKGYSIVKNSQQYRLIALSAQYLSRYYKEINKPWLALDYAHIRSQYADSSYNEESIRKLTQLEMQYQFDIKRSEDEARQTLEARAQERKNLIYFIVSSSLLFLLVTAILLLRLEKAKKRKVEFERKNLADQLEHANKELTTYVMYLLRKNEFITSIAEKLKLAKPVIKNENKKVIGDLIRELESNSGMISWDEFEVRFQKVYTGFYKKLNTLYPDLSPNELRLCAFFKLNMTTKEISAITYQSINSITVARYRLRKKLGLTTNEHLVTFLSTL
jgi:DNA-binding CsgD family transcriptional regulator